MKNNPLIAILLGVLLVSSLVSVYFAFSYIRASRQLRTLQSQVTNVQNNRNIMNALAADVLEYSKKNSAIDPILESVNLKHKTNAAPAGSPAKPGSR